MPVGSAPDDPPLPTRAFHGVSGDRGSDEAICDEWIRGLTQIL
jgi:hypothetical protein